MVNPILVSAWLSKCEETHNHDCTPNTMPSGRSFVFRVIDVCHGCVIEAPENCKYVALSYVWGGIKQLQLTREKDSLENFQYASKTVKDAIEFCHKLGVAYLWVDTLCIIQNDPDDMKAQIQAMDLIYSCAYATIVAASGRTAHAGLPGVKRNSREAPVSGVVEGLGLMISTRDAISSVIGSPWHSRAWTFQEKIFSNRLVVFTDQQVFLYCNNAFWREDHVVEDETSFYRSLHMKHLQRLPDTIRTGENIDSDLVLEAFRKYQKMVGEYSVRKLTKEEDILNAFSGVQRVLSPLLSGFNWGLPNCCFEAALTWRSSLFPLPRRNNFPSWSWTGWKNYKGPVNISSNEPPGYEVNFSWGYGSEVTWYQLLDSDGSVSMISNEKPHRFSSCSLRRDIRAQTRSKYHVSRVELPPGLRSPFSQYLVFWTSSATFGVGHVSQRHLEGGSSGFSGGFMHYNKEFAIKIPGRDGRIGTVSLDADWRARQPDEMEFIVIATDWNCNLLAMLIEWRNGVAYRVQMASAPIDQWDWGRGKPQRKMIILG
jgi:hypothetical protein